MPFAIKTAICIAIASLSIAAFIYACVYFVGPGFAALTVVVALLLLFSRATIEYR